MRTRALKTVLILFASTILFATMAGADSFHIVRDSDGMLLEAHLDTSVVDEIGLLGGDDPNFKDLTTLGGRLFQLAENTRGDEIIHEISLETGAILSTLALSYGGEPVERAASLAAIGSRLWVSFALPGSSTENTLAEVMEDGELDVQVATSVDIDSMAWSEGALYGVNAAEGGPKFYSIDLGTGSSTLLFVGDPSQYRLNDLVACPSVFTIVDQVNQMIHEVDMGDGSLLTSYPTPGAAKGIATLALCNPLFTDGFESGDLAIWSQSVP